MAVMDVKALNKHGVENHLFRSPPGEAQTLPAFLWQGREAPQLSLLPLVLFSKETKT